jgi:hypothetical protein
MAGFWAVWLLEDFILGPAVDWGNKGSLRYWKEIKQYDNGTVLIQRGNNRAILFTDEIKAGEKHMDPNFSYPLGLHFGIKYVGNISWAKRKLSEMRGYDK